MRKIDELATSENSYMDMSWLISMRHARMVSDTGRAKTLTHGIFALTAQDGLDRIMLSCGLNRVLVTFVASASKNGLRETAVPIS